MAISSAGGRLSMTQVAVSTGLGAPSRFSWLTRKSPQVIPERASRTTTCPALVGASLTSGRRPGVAGLAFAGIGVVDDGALLPDVDPVAAGRDPLLAHPATIGVHAKTVAASVRARVRVRMPSMIGASPELARAIGIDGWRSSPVGPVPGAARTVGPGAWAKVGQKPASRYAPRNAKAPHQQGFQI